MFVLSKVFEKSDSKKKTGKCKFYVLGGNAVWCSYGKKMKGFGGNPKNVNFLNSWKIKVKINFFNNSIVRIEFSRQGTLVLGINTR